MGIYTKMSNFDNLYNNIQEFENGKINLVEALTKAQVNQIRKEVATPEILPCDFDVSVPGWIERIKEWGKIVIYHKDPENFRGKKKVTISQFVNRLQAEDIKKMLSAWYIEKKGLTKVRFFKDYVGKGGDKVFTEEFNIEVKLRKELRGFRLW